MPDGSVTLLPGVNAERTPTLLQAGYSQSALIRFKDSLAQKLGGWVKFFASAIPGIPRALHAWQDLNQVNHLAVGTTTQFDVITSGNLKPITPQTKTTSFSPNFSTVMNTPTVTIVDSNVTNLTTFDSIFFNTPVAVGGLILSGLYPIVLVSGASTYKITASSNAASTVNNVGAVPVFNTTSGSASIAVTLTAHGRSVGDTVVFPISTTVGGVTILGAYVVATVTNANAFTITVSVLASASTSASMNSGNAQLVYYFQTGPAASGTGFGFGPFGSGGFGGTGTPPISDTGTPITATDYTIDNWGEIVVFCPKGGGIYTWDPTGGFVNAGLIATGPVFNSGIFVSITTQILIAYGSTAPEGIGVVQDPLLVKWSDLGNFNQWAVTSQTQAGSYRIPTGSKIIGGMAASLKNLIWTDLDLWAMTYIGQPLVYGFDKIGSGAGLVSAHGFAQMRGNVYWMGPSNFFVLSGGGVQVLPCPVWDVVFQDLDTANLDKCWCEPNTPFNEAMFFYPSLSGGTGQCDKYVKINILEPGRPWDYGPMQRSAGIDQSVLGSPIMASSSPAFIYQHEMTNNADGQALSPSFTTGYFYIAEGQDFAFVDQIIPDFRFGTFGDEPDANVQVTFNVVDYPGDTPRTYGPYTFNSTTEYITTRFRGRQMSVTVSSSDLDSFWRLGHVRYRFAPAGRR